MSGPFGAEPGSPLAFPLTRRLAEFCMTTKAEAVPSVARDHARQLVLDTIGVALLASRHRIGRIISVHAATFGAHRPVASVIGAGRLQVDTLWAAQANGTMANALDYDSGGHLPTHILPAVLAIAEERGLRGADALTAFILAYEGAARLTKVIDAKRALHQGPTYRGWWHVGLIAPVAASLAACRLLGATVEQTQRAIGVATASSAGFRRSMGTMTKALHSGNGARAGMEAALLAMDGFTGDPEIIEGELGFVGAIAHVDERDPLPIAEKLGAPFVLEKSPGVKRYPAVTPSHGVITAAIELAQKNAFDPTEIESVEADYRTFSLSKREARDEEEASFCAPYLIAASLVYGAFGAHQIEHEAIQNPVVQALARKVIQIPKAEGDGNLVTIRLRNGVALSARARGQRAFEPAFILTKFGSCASHAGISATAVDEIIDIVSHLEAQPNLVRLMQLVRGEA